MERDEEMVRSRVLERMDLTKELTDEQILEVIREEICSYANHHSMGIARRMQMQRNIFHSLRRLDVLQELLEDDTVTEIMVNGCGSTYFERGGVLYPLERVFEDDEQIKILIDRIKQHVKERRQMLAEGRGVRTRAVRVQIAPAFWEKLDFFALADLKQPLGEAPVENLGHELLVFGDGRKKPAALVLGQGCERKAHLVGRVGVARNKRLKA